MNRLLKHADLDGELVGPQSHEAEAQDPELGDDGRDDHCETEILHPVRKNFALETIISRNIFSFFEKRMKKAN